MSENLPDTQSLLDKIKYLEDELTAKDEFYEKELQKQDAHIEFLEKELYGDKTKKFRKRKK